MPLLLVGIVLLIIWGVISFLAWAITGVIDIFGGWFNTLLIVGIILVAIALFKKEK